MWRFHLFWLDIEKVFSPIFKNKCKKKSLTVYFLWSKRKNKFHFSIFWESVIYKWSRRYPSRQLAETITNTGTIIQLLSWLYLWKSRQAHLSQRRRWGHEGHRCETAPGTSRLDKGFGSVCDSTWANGWKNKVDESSSPSRAKRIQQGRLVRFDSGWRLYGSWTKFSDTRPRVRPDLHFL